MKLSLVCNNIINYSLKECHIWKVSFIELNKEIFSKWKLENINRFIETHLTEVIFIENLKINEKNKSLKKIEFNKT